MMTQRELNNILEVLIKHDLISLDFAMGIWKYGPPISDIVATMILAAYRYQQDGDPKNRGT